MNPPSNPVVVGEYSFTASTDGSVPQGLIQVPNTANFLVTNRNGGANGDGTVFQASLGLDIFGQVALSGGGSLSGVTLTLTSGSQTAGSTVTGAPGNYAFFVAAGGSYTVTPSLSGYAFTPASTSFSNLSANQAANFTATQASATTYTLSGQVQCPGCAGGFLTGATITLSGSANATTTIDSSGNYSFTEQAGGTYTLTPTYSAGGYTFSPTSASFANLSGNQVQNFTAATSGTGGGYTISGESQPFAELRSAASP